MAYMLDLHLFLGRRLQNEVAAGEEYDANQVYYGSMPRLTLESETEYVRQLVREGGLEMLEDVTARAYKKYLSMRPGASNASVKRAKAMTAPSLHPMFIGIDILHTSDVMTVVALVTHLRSTRVPIVGDDGKSDAKEIQKRLEAQDNEKKREEFLAAIKGRKSTQTIFEVIESKRNSSAMAQKRRTHENIIRTRAAATPAEEDVPAGSAQAARSAEDVDEGLDIDDNDLDMEHGNGDDDDDSDDNNDNDNDTNDGNDGSGDDSNASSSTTRGTKRKGTDTSTNDTASSTTPSTDTTTAAAAGPRKRVKKTDFRDAKFFMSAMPPDGDAEKG
jgi:hypothetical protein